MAPEHVYFLALALIAFPLLPFARTALIVVLGWLPGQFTYLIGADTARVDMVVALLACGACFGVAANGRDRIVGALFGATAAVQFSLAVGNTPPFEAWWADWYLAMMRVGLLPFTVDWSALRDVYDAFKRRREWNDMVWRRALCWH